MSDQRIAKRIEALVEEEQNLYRHGDMDEQKRKRVKDLEVGLANCLDNTFVY